MAKIITSKYLINKIKNIFGNIPEKGLSQLLEALDAPCKSPPNTPSSNYSEDLAFQIACDITKSESYFPRNA